MPLNRQPGVPGQSGPSRRGASLKLRGSVSKRFCFEGIPFHSVPTLLGVFQIILGFQASPASRPLGPQGPRPRRARRARSGGRRPYPSNNFRSWRSVEFACKDLDLNLLGSGALVWRSRPPASPNPGLKLALWPNCAARCSGARPKRFLGRGPVSAAPKGSFFRVSPRHVKLNLRPHTEPLSPTCPTTQVNKRIVRVTFLRRKNEQIRAISTAVVIWTSDQQHSGSGLRDPKSRGTRAVTARSCCCPKGSRAGSAPSRMRAETASTAAALLGFVGAPG